MKLLKGLLLERLWYDYAASIQKEIFANGKVSTLTPERLEIRVDVLLFWPPISAVVDCCGTDWVGSLNSSVFVQPCFRLDTPIAMRDSASSCRVSSPSVFGSGACSVQQLSRNMLDAVVKSCEPESESKNSWRQAVQLFGRKEWYQRFVIRFDTEFHSQNVGGELFAGPSCSKCLLLDLGISTFRFSHRS